MRGQDSLQSGNHSTLPSMMLGPRDTERNKTLSLSLRNRILEGKIVISGEFPGSPVVRTPHSHCPGSIPGQGTKIPQGTQYGQKK